MTSRRLIIAVLSLLVLIFGYHFESSSAVLHTVHRNSSSAAAMAARVSTSHSFPPSFSGTVSVSRVIDGDTIVVSLVDSNGETDGKIQDKVRLIGIDTPETVDPRKAVQCFGKQASYKTKGLLPPGTHVTLTPDATQNDRDKYGRLLRYITLEDGTDLNKMLIEQGFAHEYTYRVPYERQKAYKQAQIEAEKEKQGLWGDGVCGVNL